MNRKKKLKKQKAERSCPVFMKYVGTYSMIVARICTRGKCTMALTIYSTVKGKHAKSLKIISSSSFIDMWMSDTVHTSRNERSPAELQLLMSYISRTMTLKEIRGNKTRDHDNISIHFYNN